jgi:hypothetical protein
LSLGTIVRFGFVAQLLGVRRTTVTLTMSKLRAAGAIPSDRRGFVEIDRARLERVACCCYALMQRKIDRMYCQELSAPQPGLAPFRKSSIEITPPDEPS